MTATAMSMLLLRGEKVDERGSDGDSGDSEGEGDSSTVLHKPQQCDIKPPSQGFSKNLQKTQLVGEVAMFQLHPTLPPFIQTSPRSENSQLVSSTQRFPPSPPHRLPVPSSHDNGPSSPPLCIINPPIHRPPPHPRIPSPLPHLQPSPPLPLPPPPLLLPLQPHLPKPPIPNPFTPPKTYTNPPQHCPLLFI